MWSGKAKPEQSARFGAQDYEPRVRISAESLAHMMADDELHAEGLNTFMVSLNSAEIDRLRIFTTAQFVTMDEFIDCVRSKRAGVYTIERQHIHGTRFTYLVAFYGASVTMDKKRHETLEDAFVEYLTDVMLDPQHPGEWKNPH